MREQAETMRNQPYQYRHCGLMLAGNVLMVLKARGIAVARDAAELREFLGALSGDAAMEAALACTDGANFRRRLGEQRAGSLSTGGRPSGQK